MNSGFGHHLHEVPSTSLWKVQSAAEPVNSAGQELCVLYSKQTGLGKIL